MPPAPHAPASSLHALQASCRGHPMREQLLKDWIAFATSHQQLASLQQLPSTRSGRPIDWLRLYEHVVARGGYRMVCRHQQWASIASRECMNLDVMPYQLAIYYERYLAAFEEKQLFGSDSHKHKRSAADVGKEEGEEDGDGESMQQDGDETIATTTEVQDAPSVRSTPLPAAKRLKVQSQFEADGGTLQALVLALDSQIPDQVTRAINLLNVLSYGTRNIGAMSMPHGAHAAAGAESENEFFVDNVPGLLDALLRQLQACKLVPFASELQAASEAQSERQKLLNLDYTVGQRGLLDARALLLLNIIRNLSMVSENEIAISKHEDLVVFLILALREIRRHRAIGDHVLDILCNIGKKIDFLALHPQAKIELWSPDVHIAAHLWKKERVLPLECLLQQLRDLIACPGVKRSFVLRACEALCHVTRDIALRPLLASSPSLQDPEMLDRLIGFLACSRQDFMTGRTGNAGGASNRNMDVDDDEDDETEEEDDDEPEDESTRWPAPWESDGLPANLGMGIVYVTPDGMRNAQSMVHVEVDAKIDHEMRDAALEVLFRLSDCSHATKLQLAKHPYCLRRLSDLLTSCIGRPEAARIAVSTLSNISMHRDTFPYFLPIERDLVLLACSDRSVADILCNVVADVYGMPAI